MPQSLAQLWIHIVFATKDRRQTLKNPAFRTEMFRVLARCVQRSGCVNAIVGGHFDHVHLLVGLCRTMTVAKLVEVIKANSSKWANQTVHLLSGFRWQSGYGAFSVSHSNCESVRDYIRCQEVHHRKMTFQEEYGLMCAQHDVELDERYVWD